MSLAEKWGLPEWRDENQYTETDELSNDQWRWEFLRRRTDYREDYEKSKDYFWELGADKETHFQETYRIRFIENPAYSIRDLKEQRKVSKELFKPNPDIEFIDSMPGALYRYPSLNGGYMKSSMHPHHLELKIDLGSPLAPQFKKLREIAKSFQSSWSTKTRRPQKGKWPTYLRILDAREIGVTYREIGEVILGHQDYDEAGKRAHEHFKLAISLQREFPVFI